ncbi:UDP-galactose phosphate transferase [Vagococcus elongatus]|uniref:UDP-galactose phosphate transferase n=2 Tax=Vagococcus elongatus TaxID=180344 RepID=A0A430B1Q5_9ENTE|nr:UDP-galactose phosphate transferase [Vagococcus elongatus]
MKQTFYCKYGKRFLDIVLSGLALLVFSPVILFVGILVRVKLGSPVIFSQSRPGLNEKIFKMYKFRTMTAEEDQDGNLLPDEQRLTRFGKLLRATSLDELPELWNILKGDMSIVGPRPQLIKDLHFMSSVEKKRQAVLPGLTGLAQVNGRNAISWGKKLNYDLIYIKNITFFNDLKIILLTVGKVFKRENISADGMETAEDLGDYLLRMNKISQEEYNKILGEILND